MLFQAKVFIQYETTLCFAYVGLLLQAQVPPTDHKKVNKACFCLPVSVSKKLEVRHESGRGWATWYARALLSETEGWRVAQANSCSSCKTEHDEWVRTHLLLSHGRAHSDTEATRLLCASVCQSQSRCGTRAGRSSRNKAFVAPRPHGRARLLLRQRLGLRRGCSVRLPASNVRNALAASSPANSSRSSVSLSA